MIKPRVRQRPSFYKRAVLLFDSKPMPWWKFRESNIVPIAYDGRFWIECQMMNGARAQRVVRHGYPAFDESKEPDLDPEWVGKMGRSSDFIVRDVRMSPDRHYLNVLSYWPILAVVALLFLSWQISGIVFLAELSPFFLWLRLVLRGGVGNVPIAKDMLGIHRPFILTAYGLERHVRERMEVGIEEGLAGQTA